MKVYRDDIVDGVVHQNVVFDIPTCTYSGKDMGERSIVATIEYSSPIDFKVGDYVILSMQNLNRNPDGMNGDLYSEKFYIYTMPTIKKNARALSSPKAFEHTVTFYPAQYELGCVQMRDLGGSINPNNIIYTGFDSVTFNGGAKELMERIMVVLADTYKDAITGEPLWSYEISDAVNEEKNIALERFDFSFSGNSVMDALLELSKEDGINTNFYINDRTIYVGFKRPYFCRVTDGLSIDVDPSTQIFNFQYGKTSHKAPSISYGGLYNITKSVGKETPITKLYAYGASRNLNRYYCSDRISSGRYVNRLMLPSFDNDGRTDFILSEEGVEKYGIHEASKQFEEIYPSLRYMTYGDIRQVKYCIKVKNSGLEDADSYGVTRIQCYKVEQNLDTGINSLVEAAPPDDLCIIIHAVDKIVKVILYGGSSNEEALTKQLESDARVPTRSTGGSDYIPGSCFVVHQRGFDSAFKEYENESRDAWFYNPDNLPSYLTDKQKEEIKNNQIAYTDTFWLSDLYIFQDYEQTFFQRDGYSAWAWARLNSHYVANGGHVASDNVLVNEIVAVEPISIPDTSLTAASLDKQQQTFDIYLRDVGFKIDEQNDFGEMVFVVGTTVTVNFLDGLLTGNEFTVSGTVVDSQSSCICAFNDDGSINEEFFLPSDYNDDSIPHQAFDDGAIWRLRLNRTNLDNPDYSNLNISLPNTQINASKGDHIVFLEIFMPDIYIKAAENRLFREAQKYLYNNDDSKVSYSVQFDKVRLQQIPMYALQMREGVTMRIVDDDLNIKTENNGRYLVNYQNNPLYSSTTYKDYDDHWLSINDGIVFSRHKTYSVVIELIDNGTFIEGGESFALLPKRGDDEIYYMPQYTYESEINGNRIKYTFTFDTDDSFNDSILYYPSVLVSAMGSENMEIWFYSVFEKDFQNEIGDINYADLTIDSISIKISGVGDSTPIREITATLSEHANASSWVTLRNQVIKNTIEGEQTKKAIETVVNTARRNYQTILSLKDSIFDPDGTCDQTFLQVMMLQVGADSMNYRLLNTSIEIGFDDHNNQVFIYKNFSCEKDIDNLYHFKVFNADKLMHYVYTHGSQAGNWEIRLTNGIFDATLDGISTYYVCLKCRKNGDIGSWVCSTKQYSVNDTEDENCWYFNWGIITPDGAGNYTITETRGNAYMYGDNLICGRISTIAKNSYFDLTNGDFVLGDGTKQALSYINGVLTIDGINDDNADSFLNRLINSETNSNLALEKAENAIFIAESNKEVHNYYEGADIVKNITAGTGYQSYWVKLLDVHAGYFQFIANEEISPRLGDPFSASSIVICDLGAGIPIIDGSSSSSSIKHILSWGSNVDLTEPATIYVAFAQSDFLEYCYDYNDERVTYASNAQWKISNIQVLASFQELLEEAIDKSEEAYVKAVATDYLREALTSGTTEIGGGIVMTTMLHLKNLQNFVTAGLSGLSKDNILLWGGATYDEAFYAAQHDEYRTGENGRPITTLLKKDGTGKIGVYKISETQAIVDVPNQGKVVIDASNENGGIYIQNKLGIDKAVISTKNVDDVTIKNSYEIPYIKNVSANTRSEDGYFATMLIQTLDSQDYADHYLNGDLELNCIVPINPYGITTTSKEVELSINVMLEFIRDGEKQVEHLGSIYFSVSAEVLLNAYRHGENFYMDIGDGIYGIDVTIDNAKLTRIYADFNLYVQGGETPDCTIETHDIISCGLNYNLNDSITLVNNPFTAICANGMMTKFNNDTLFKVVNSDNGQKIFAKGLSNKKGDSGSGELYVSEDFIEAFKDFLSYMKIWVADVRSVGSNHDKADTMIAKCNEVYNKITETSFIANS